MASDWRAGVNGGRKPRRSLSQQAITGMNLSTLSRVLLRNRGRVNWRYFPRLALLLALGGLNSYLARLEQAVDGAGIAAAELTGPPVFVLGYWRSGTTHLHNLLNCDPHFTCPTSYQAMCPHHFVYSQPWGAPIFNRLTPGKRPMDNVAINGATPHEEEMALAGLCGVSPSSGPVPGLGGRRLLRREPRRVTARGPGRLGEGLAPLPEETQLLQGETHRLEIPPHLGRIPHLLKMFPGAKFVHIVRNPYAVYLSSQKLWRSGLSHSHLQKADAQRLDELILSWSSSSMPSSSGTGA